MQIPSPSPPIIIDQYWSLIQCSFYHIYLCPLILCLIYSSPAQCFVAPPQKEDCSTVRCRPGRHFVFFHLHFIFYRNLSDQEQKQDVLYGTVYKLLTKCCPKKCFSAFAAYVVAILITHHHHHHNRKLECSPLFSKW